MSRIAYIDGTYTPLSHAVTSVEDRGYVFGDGIYEVIAVERGALIDGAAHFARLRRSLKEVGIADIYPEEVLRHLIRELFRKNQMTSGILYLQLTRGIGPRNHIFPANLEPVLSIWPLELKLATPAQMQKGIEVITMPDPRWNRCDIKVIALLPNTLAKNQAKAAGTQEAWFINADGFVTESSSSNVFIVDQNGVLRTHPADNAILWGVTRNRLLQIAKQLKLKVSEKPFTMADVAKAREAFVSSTTQAAMPVLKVDKKPVGNGKVGPVTTQLAEAYHRFIEEEVAAASRSNRRIASR